MPKANANKIGSKTLYKIIRIHGVAIFSVANTTVLQLIYIRQICP